MLYYRSAWLTGGWLLVGFVVYLSLTPHPPDALSLPFPYADKLGHGLAYASLSLWFCQICLPARQRTMVIAALIGLGITLEFVQGMTDYRSFEIADMVANSIGVLLGLLVAHTPLGRLLVWVESRFNQVDSIRGR